MNNKQNPVLASPRSHQILLADVLTCLLKAVRSRAIKPRDLMVKGRLSLTRIAVRQDNIPHLNTNVIVGNPKLFHLFRELKFACEGVVLVNDEVAAAYSEEIEELRALRRSFPTINSPTALAQSNPRLYKRISAIPYSSTIFRYAEMTAGRPDYMYWDDAEIVKEAAGRCDSFSELKYALGQLHRQIKGRRLENALVRANPLYARFFYVGLGGNFYRSEPELVVGNCFHLLNVDCEREVSTGVLSEGSKKPRKADFFLPQIGYYLELTQNEAGDRGSRRKEYCDRNLVKRNDYARHGDIQCLFVDSDRFYQRGVFDAAGFLSEVLGKLRIIGMDISNMPPIKDVLYRDDTVKMRVLQESPKSIIDYLLSLGVDGKSTLQNHYSYLLTCLQYRSDYHEVLKKIKAIGLARRNESNRQRHEKNRLAYAPLYIVVQLFKEENINSQPEWWYFVDNNKDRLRALKIPSNIQDVYKRLGQWKGWASMYPKYNSTNCPVR